MKFTQNVAKGTIKALGIAQDNWEAGTDAGFLLVTIENDEIFPAKFSLSVVCDDAVVVGSAPDIHLLGGLRAMEGVKLHSVNREAVENVSCTVTLLDSLGAAVESKETSFSIARGSVKHLRT